MYLCNKFLEKEARCLKNYKNLTRWYLEIANREAVIKGYDFMKKGEATPKP